MENKDLKSIAGITNSISYLFYYPELIKNAVEQEKLIVEIAAIANVTPNEVKEFYKLHQRFSLPYIKQAVLLCGELDLEKMEKAVMEQIGPNRHDEEIKIKLLNSVISQMKEDLLTKNSRRKFFVETFKDKENLDDFQRGVRAAIALLEFKVRYIRGK